MLRVFWDYLLNTFVWTWNVDLARNENNYEVVSIKLRLVLTYMCTIVFVHVRGVGVLALMSCYKCIPHFKQMILMIFFLILKSFGLL